MDWTKTPLTRPVVRTLLLKLNLVLRDKGVEQLPHDARMLVAYSADQFAWFISKTFEGKSGRTLTPDEEEKLEVLGGEVLEELTTEGLMEEVREGWWRGLVDPDGLPTYEAAQAATEATAEISIGEGPESVYGWYLPTYRALATLKEEDRFPMKVGTTTANPSKRMRVHIGTAPEKPKLGFVWKIKHAAVLEKWLHLELDQRGHHIDEALGTEWFRTTPQELYEIVKEMAAKMMGQEDGSSPEGPKTQVRSPSAK